MSGELERRFPQLPLPAGLSAAELPVAAGAALAFVQGIRLAARGLQQLMELIDRADDDELPELRLHPPVVIGEPVVPVGAVRPAGAVLPLYVIGRHRR